MEFVEQKTDYQAVYFSIKGVDGYFAFKMRNDEQVPLGKRINIYIPYNRIKIYDERHNKLNAREVLYENKGMCTVTVKNNMMRINVGGSVLTYPNTKNYQEGRYEISFKEDKLVPIYTKKMLKKNPGLTNVEMEIPSNKIKVSAYDEDVLGDKLLIYVQIAGFNKYSSFIVDNKFSVYKMPKLEMYVPEDAFTLTKVK